MIFISIIKGVGCAIIVLLSLILTLKLIVNNLHFNDEVSFLLAVSLGASVVLMSIYFSVDGSAKKVAYAQTQINNALLQNQSNLNQKSIIDYIDENLPDFSSTIISSQYSASELNSLVNKYAKLVLDKLHIIKYITLTIEIIIQLLILVLVRNKAKGKQGGYGSGTSYMSGGYYE